MSTTVQEQGSRPPAPAAPLLALEDLVVQLPVEGELRTVLHGVSFAIRPGEALGLVGESGSGKSMTARAIDRLLPPGAVCRVRSATTTAT